MRKVIIFLVLIFLLVSIVPLEFQSLSGLNDVSDEEMVINQKEDLSISPDSLSEQSRDNSIEFDHQNDWFDAETIKVNQEFPFSNNLETGVTSSSEGYDHYVTNDVINTSILTDDGISQDFIASIQGESSSEYYSIYSISSFTDTGTLTIDDCSSNYLRFHDQTNMCQFEEQLSDMSSPDVFGVDIVLEVYGGTSGFVVSSIQLYEINAGPDEYSAWVNLMYEIDANDIDVNGRIPIKITLDWYASSAQIMTVEFTENSQITTIDYDQNDAGFAQISPPDDIGFFLDFLTFIPDLNSESANKAGVSDTSGEIDIDTSDNIIDVVSREFWNAWEFNIFQARVLYTMYFDITVDIDAYTTDSSTTTSHSFSSTSQQFDQTSYGEILSFVNDYYAKVQVNVSAKFILDTSGTDHLEIELSIDLYDELLSTWTNKYSNTDTSSDLSTNLIYILNSIDLHIDLLNAKRPSVEFQKLTQKKINDQDPSQGQMKLDIQIDQLGANVTLSPSNQYNFSDINPYAPVTWDTGENDLWFIATFIGTYSMKFLYGPGFGRDYTRQKQILAIEDVTDDYLECSGFECGAVDQFDITVNPPISLNVNTTVVHEGAFSIRFEAGSSDNLNYVLPDGDYYISFSYYVESYSTDNFNLWIYNNGWVENDLSLVETNRWIDVFLTFHIDGIDTSPDRNFVFQWNGASGIVFLDTIRFFKASGKVETTGYQQYEFSAQFRSIPNFIPVPDIEAHLLLLDRNDQTYIWDASVYTDENGIAIISYSGYFETKEYEMVWSTSETEIGYTKLDEDYEDGTAGNHVDDFTDWSHVATSQFDYSVSRSYEGSQSGVFIENTETPDYFASDSDFSLKSPTLSFWYNRNNGGKQIIQFITDADDDDITNNLIWQIDDDSAGTATTSFYLDSVSIGSTSVTIDDDTWYFVEIKLIGNSLRLYYENELIIDVTLDSSQLKEIFGGYEGVLSIYTSWDGRAVYFDNLLITEASTSSYFTPLPTNTQSYSYEKNGIQSNIENYVDMSESVLELKNGGSVTDYGAENGYQFVELSSSQAYGGVRFDMYDFGEFDETVYATLIMRVKANISMSLTVEYWKNSGASFIGYAPFPALTSSWQIFEFDISGIVDVDRIKMHVGASPSNCRIEFDYFYFTDTWDQGIAFEFEEEEEVDASDNGVNGWGEAQLSSSTVTIENGILEHSSTNTFRGITRDFEYLQSLEGYTVSFLLRSDEIGHNYQLNTRDISGSVIEQHLFTPTSEWVVYRFTLTDSTAVKQMKIQDGGYSSNHFEIKYIRISQEDGGGSDLNIDTTTGLTWFDDQSNHTVFYQTWINGSSYGIYSEFNPFSIPFEEGVNYDLDYAELYDLDDPKEPQLLNTIYRLEYEITVDFVITNFNFYLSDFDEFLTFHSTLDGSVTIYHNDTTVDTASITQGYNTISSSRDLTEGAIIFYAALFTSNDGQSGWYNTTISNQDLIESYQVHIDLIDGQGLGLSFETLAVYVNISGTLTRVSQDFTWYNSSIQIVVKDFFDITLWTSIEILNENTDNFISVVVPVFEVSYWNPYAFTVILSIERNDIRTSYFVVTNTSLILRQSVGYYRIILERYYDGPEYSDNLVGNEVYTHLPTVDSITVSSTVRSLTLYLEPIFADDAETPVTDIESFRLSPAGRFLSNITYVVGIALVIWRIRAVINRPEEKSVIEAFLGS